MLYGRRHQGLVRGRLLSLQLAGFLLVAVGCNGSQKSDAWMRQHLAEHRADFERLVRMANEDYDRTQVIRIAYDFTRTESTWAWPRPQSEWGLTNDRWEEYRTLFKRLSLPSGLERVGGGVQFTVYGFGMAGEGREYGFLWRETPPAQIKTRREEYTTKPFDKNWYRYEWFID